MIKIRSIGWRKHSKDWSRPFYCSAYMNLYDSRNTGNWNESIISRNKVKFGHTNAESHSWGGLGDTKTQSIRNWRRLQSLV